MRNITYLNRQEKYKALNHNIDIIYEKLAFTLNID